VLDADGWLATGDVVTVDEDGYVAIVDRKKELIINASGKNISPSNIENAIKATIPVAGVAVTIGDARPYITALIVLDADATGALAAKRGLAEASAQALAADPSVLAVVAAGIAQANAKLSRVEQVKRFRVLPVYWKPGGDELTPTLKVRRRAVTRKYAAEIEALYAATPGPCVYEVGTHTGRTTLVTEPGPAL
jgi:long-subunit acyl-CoA synthetase (AMP-forming)